MVEGRRHHGLQGYQKGMTTAPAAAGAPRPPSQPTQGSKHFPGRGSASGTVTHQGHQSALVLRVEGLHTVEATC